MKHVTIIVMILCLTACADPTGNVVVDDEITIGAVLILSGAPANWGINSQRGIELALKDINSAGGIDGKKLKVVYEDNPENKPETAVSAFQKLQAEGIQIFVGPNWVTSSLAVAPIACSNQLLVVAPTVGSTDFHEQCDYLFDLWANDDLLSISLSDYMYENDFRKIAILGSQDSWEMTQAENVKKQFEKIGGEVSSFQISKIDEIDFRTEVLKIRESDAEAVVFTNFGHAHLSAKRMREMGVTVPFFSIILDDERIAEGAFEDAVIITSFTPRDDFSEMYFKVYGEKIDAGAATSYDSVMLIAEALRSTNSEDPTVLKEYLKGLEHYDGMSGDLEFNGKGTVLKKSLFLTVKNGEFVPLEV